MGMSDNWLTTVSHVNPGSSELRGPSSYLPFILAWSEPVAANVVPERIIFPVKIFTTVQLE